MDRPDPRHDDNIVAGGKPVLVQPIDLPQAAAHFVAHHGVAELGAGGQPQAALPAAVAAAVENHRGGHGALALGVQPAKDPIFL